MGKIDDSTIQQVMDKADIVEVIGDFVELKQQGPRWIGLCPFHDDKHATNFSVYPSKQCYTCFACGAKGDVVKFLMEHERMSFPDAIRWLGKKYNIPVDDVPLNYTPPPPRPKPEPLPMLEITKGYVRPGRIEEDNLVNWMLTVPWDGAQRARIVEVLKEYHVGHSRTGFTVFWQIDEEGKVRTGKMMKYKTDGHRDKESQYNFDWVHSVLNRQHIIDTSKVEVKPCLFGLHLLDKYKGADVCIVESEKTAVLMAIAYGNHEKQLWMACGGLQNISKEKLDPIIKQGRRIVLYPDRDGVEAWKKKAYALGYINMTVDARPVTKWWKPQDGEKADIADVVVRSIIEHQKT